jgi:hypothetical protein
LLAAAPYATYAASAGTVTGLIILQNSNGAPNLIAGSPGNLVAIGVLGATITGGGATYYDGFTGINSVSADFGTISGGYQNTIQTGARCATIGGGAGNMIETNADHGTIAGGGGNYLEAGAINSTIGGGHWNTIKAGSTYATVGGGGFNIIEPNTFCSTIGGGDGNTIQPNAKYAAIPGGYQNTATNYAFAAGDQAQAIHTGAFVWADSTPVAFSSTTTNEFAVRASGGARFVTGNPGLTVFGPVTAMAFNTSSDRNLKEHLGAVKPREVLDQVASLPIWRWNFKADAGTPHIGPTAQDFYAAFSVGSDDRHIATVDADGVALAAIQGLNQKLEETRADNAALAKALTARDAQVQALQSRLEALEKRLVQ